MSKNGTLLTLAIITALGLVGHTASAAPLPNDNVKLSFPYPQYDYSFQDHRSIHDILAQREHPDLWNSGDPDDSGPVALCFSKDNPPSQEVMDQVNAYIAQRGYSSRYQIGARWSQGSQGDPIQLTWSFVPDGVTVGTIDAPGGAGASSLFSRMDQRFGAANRAVWIAQFQACFDRWQAVTGVTYTRVTSGSNPWDDGAAWGNLGGSSRGDIRIGMKNIDNANGILAYNSFPQSGDMVLDSSEQWQQGAPFYLFLRDVVMHEHGHGLGLSHVCPQQTPNTGGAKLMAPFVDTSFDGPQQDDIRAGQFQYGDPYEPNDNAASATVLGNLAAGGSFNIGTVPSPTPTTASLLSIDNNGDEDWFKMTVDAPRLVNVTVTPIGSNYLNSPQDANCVGNGTSVAAFAVADLQFEVRNSLGTTLWRSINNTAAGSTETVSGVLVSPAGDFFVRVLENGFPTEAQAYRLSVAGQSVSMQPSASQGTFNNLVRITWPNVIPDVTQFTVTRATTNNSSFSFTIATLASNVFQFDDTTAVPGTQYYYFVRAQQTGSTTLRFISTDGAPGYRSIANTAPIANAGPDQILDDADRNGSEAVTLDGSASSDAEGPIANYTWRRGTTTLASTSSPLTTITLDVGTHLIDLTVTDSGGLTATDQVSIVINPGCAADFNNDGGVDGGDVAAFFQAFGSGLDSADINQDGGVDGADVEAFFRVWTMGGC